MSKGTANAEEISRNFLCAISSDTRKEVQCKKEPSWALILLRSLKSISLIVPKTELLLEEIQVIRVEIYKKFNVFKPNDFH